MKISLNDTLDHIAFVVSQGIEPNRAVFVVRQVEACQRAGIAPTFEETFQKWRDINVPTEVRDSIVGHRKNPHRDRDQEDEEEVKR